MSVTETLEPATAKPAVALSEKELCKYLDSKEFRGTMWRSIWCLLQNLLPMIAWWFMAARCATPEAHAATRFACGTAWGLLVLRSYMIFHDCGHGSFFQGFKGARTANWVTLQVSAVLCGTPDWNVGHQLHHANVGNTGQDDYDWGETIFHTADKFVRLPSWQQKIWKARHPLRFHPRAAAHVVLQDALAVELRPERKASYRFWDKMLSSAFMYGRYKYASLGILPLVLGGDYGHVDWRAALPLAARVRGGLRAQRRRGKIREAAMHGRRSPPFQRASVVYAGVSITTSITSARASRYMLRTVHESAPSHYWDEARARPQGDVALALPAVLGREHPKLCHV